MIARLSILLCFAATALAEPVSFYREVRPILRANCPGCHKPGKTKGGLDLTTHAAILKGGKAGALKAGGNAVVMESTVVLCPPAMLKD